VVRALNTVQSHGLRSRLRDRAAAIVLDRISRPADQGARAMSAALEFRAVDILFCAKAGRRASAAAIQQALAALDAGGTRAESPTRPAWCGRAGAS